VGSDTSIFRQGPFLVRLGRLGLRLACVVFFFLARARALTVLDAQTVCRARRGGRDVVFLSCLYAQGTCGLPRRGYGTDAAPCAEQFKQEMGIP